MIEGKVLRTSEEKNILALSDSGRLNGDPTKNFLVYVHVPIPYNSEFDTETSIIELRFMPHPLEFSIDIREGLKHYKEHTGFTGENHTFNVISMREDGTWVSSAVSPVLIITGADNRPLSVTMFAVPDAEVPQAPGPMHIQPVQSCLQDHNYARYQVCWGEPQFDEKMVKTKQRFDEGVARYRAVNDTFAEIARVSRALSDMPCIHTTKKDVSNWESKTKARPWAAFVVDTYRKLLYTDVDEFAVKLDFLSRMQRSRLLEGFADEVLAYKIVCNTPILEKMRSEFIKRGGGIYGESLFSVRDMFEVSLNSKELQISIVQFVETYGHVLMQRVIRGTLFSAISFRTDGTCILQPRPFIVDRLN